MKQILIMMITLAFAISCGSSTKEKVEKDKNKINQDLPMQNQKKEMQETAVQIKEITKTTTLDDNTGILIVRFLLEDEKGNKMQKLPNFRIKGPKNLEIDNSPSHIQKDAIHVYKMPAGQYSISSLYSINEKGEYEFDKPFLPNVFVIEKGKVNYIGDIMVRLEEEAKSSNIITRKLKLKLPANNDETITVIQDKLKEILDKYPLERKIISFK